MPQPVVTFELPKRTATCAVCKAPGLLKKFPTERFWVEFDFLAELGEDTIDEVAEAEDGGTGIIDELTPPQGAGSSAWIMVGDGATAATGSIRVDITTTLGNRISGVADFMVMPDPTDEFTMGVDSSALTNYYTMAQVITRIGGVRVVTPATGAFEWNTSEGSVLVLFMTGDVTVTIDDDANRMSLAIICIQDVVGGHSLDLHTENVLMTQDGNPISLSSLPESHDVITMVRSHVYAWYALTALAFQEV